ncbi:MAG: TIGR03915 family putative DNA repair protein [Flavobacteriaceae bacterium]
MKYIETTLIYDDGFSGFLSAIHFAFSEECSISDIMSKENGQRLLFSDAISVKTDKTAARSVWQAIQKKNYEAAKSIYFAFLSESKGIEFLLYKYIRLLVLNPTDSDNYIESTSLNKIKLLAGLVSREKKRMESQVHLEQTYPDLHLAYIEPDFNVLPLITKHFRSSQDICPWIIYDRKRKYGIYYDGNAKHIISTGRFKILLAQKQLSEPASLSLNSDSLTSVANYNQRQPMDEKAYFPKTVNAA